MQRDFHFIMCGLQLIELPLKVINLLADKI
jgi:hypothetical protein